MRKVEVVPYNPEWPALFQAEAKEIGGIFQHALQEIHHIGSTAIPGFTAKPVIDLMPAVDDLHVVDKKQSEMEALGYIAYGEHGIKERRFFTKDIAGVRAFHVHFFVKDSLHYHRHLAVRDYLIADKEARISYGSLKQALAREYPYSMDDYIQGKHEFVQLLEQRALSWYLK